MGGIHPEPLVSCPFCKTVLFCDLFMNVSGRESKDNDLDVYDYCENNNCISRFIQITYKNYVIGYDFYVEGFCISVIYKAPVILNMPSSLMQAEGLTIKDWFGKVISHVDEVFYPDFSNVGSIRERISCLLNFS